MRKNYRERELIVLKEYFFFFFFSQKSILEYFTNKKSNSDISLLMNSTLRNFPCRSLLYMALDLPAHVDFSKQLMEPDVYVSTHNTVSGIFDSKDLAVDPSDIEVVPR